MDRVRTDGAAAAARAGGRGAGAAADTQAAGQRPFDRLRAGFSDRELPEYAEDGLEACPERSRRALQQEGVQQRLPFSTGELAAPPRKGARLCVLEGFSLHADTRIHGNDRQGLRQLIRYAARGPLSLKRLTELPDGTLRYETKKAGKVVHLTAEKLVKRLAALVPPKGMHLTVPFGVFASAHALRSTVMQRPIEESQPPKKQQELPLGECPPKPPRRPRLDWAELQKKTFLEDVLACPCGGRRQVKAVIHQREAREVLTRMGVEVPPESLRARVGSSSERAPPKPQGELAL